MNRSFGDLGCSQISKRFQFRKTRFLISDDVCTRLLKLSSLLHRWGYLPGDYFDNSLMLLTESIACVRVEGEYPVRWLPETSGVLRQLRSRGVIARAASPKSSTGSEFRMVRRLAATQPLTFDRFRSGDH